ncbi:hypothetical protein NW767_015589 [Fusarium falciforme]|nr:hypothetical protein NW767_015589 [Fusarium falciforme]
MARLSSAESATPKRKSSRGVSTLTPSQLARKRANDREAQRVIRARTKEQIERLERELEELKSKQSRDHIVQKLLRHNEALEEELARLKESMALPLTSSPYTASGTTPQELSSPDELLLMSTVYDDDLSTDRDAIASPCWPSFPDGHSTHPDYSQQYVPLPNNCELWASTVPYPSPSNVSIPSSPADDYSASYILTSAPTSIVASNNSSSSSISVVGHKDVVKMEYDSIDHHCTIPQGLSQTDVRPSEEASHTQCLDAGLRLSSSPPQPDTPHSHPYMSHHHQQQCAWNMYPMYYPQAQSSVQ